MTEQGAGAVATVVSASVAVVTQMMQEAVTGASSLPVPPSLAFSVLSGVLAGGVSFGLLKGRVDSAQKRAEESHVRHDKTDTKIDRIHSTVSDIRVLVGELVGEHRARQAGAVRTRNEDDD